MSYLGIDLGGTKVRAVKIVDQSCKSYADSLIPKKGSEKEIVEIIKKLISKLIDKSVVGIGIGVPSVVDEKLGIVYDVQNIPSWKKVFLKDILESHFNIPVSINNDVNCFSLGELYFGLGKKLDSFVGLMVKLLKIFLILVQVFIPLLQQMLMDVLLILKLKSLNQLN